MGPRHDNRTRVRRVVLPSGTIVEIRDRSGGPPVQDGALHHCPSCGGGLVHPTARTRTRSGDWLLKLRCPSCEWQGGGIFGDRQVASLDDELERATAELLDELRWLSRANAQAECERFARALREGHILPMDF